jgi:hypothetical protein
MVALMVFSKISIEQYYFFESSQGGFSNRYWEWRAQNFQNNEQCQRESGSYLDLELI